MHRAGQDRRFSAVEQVWRKLPSRLIDVLPDDTTDELNAAVSRLTGMPMAQRMRSEKDLGETMVIAHAVVAAERGNAVIVLVDDGYGRGMVAKEQRRLQRLRSANSSLGSISLISTLTVLEKAAAKGLLPDRAAMRKLYKRLQELDDGLIPIGATNLMKLSCWGQARMSQAPQAIDGEQPG